METEGLDSDYENGVADVLAFLAGPTSVVERNVKLPGRRTGVDRQIDVLVTSRLLAMGETKVVVDCKRWKKPLDVTHVQSFLGLLEDVGADGGVLIATMGASAGAQTFARQERGLRIHVLSIAELAQWSPAGTVDFDYQISMSNEVAVSRALRRAGFRVRVSDCESDKEGEVVLSVFRHFGTPNPSGEVQTEASGKVDQILVRVCGGETRRRGSSLVTSGGTPGHRWLEVTSSGVPIHLKVIAASEADVEEQLDLLHPHLPPGFARDSLSVIKPDGWPVTDAFTSWRQ